MLWQRLQVEKYDTASPTYVRRRINSLHTLSPGVSATTMSTAAFSEQALREQLARILASEAFKRGSRSGRLLTYLVEQTVAGRAQYLKEYTLGVEALQRGADFDPRSDPVARVEASRLRSKLEVYYATVGNADPIVVALPKGSYVPTFEAREVAAAAVASSERIERVHRTGLRPAWPIAAAAALGAAVAMLTVVWMMRPEPDPTHALLKLDVALGAPGVLSTEVGSNLALSPDGSVLVFLALRSDGTTRLYARRLDELTANELPGTADARGPFFSPDGRWVGFMADGKLKKTLVAGGGSPTTLAAASDFLGASWGTNGDIVAKLTSPQILWRVPENGGEPVPILDASADGVSPRFPQVLPDGRHVLITAMRGLHASVEVLSLSDGSREMLIASGMYGRYLHGGYLSYVDGGTLFAVPFDLEALEVRGTPVAVLEGVAYSPTFGYAQFAAADTGVAVYQRAGGGGRMTVARLTRDGGKTALLPESAHYQWPRLSPDGSRLAIAKLEGNEFGMWIHDVATATGTRLGRGATPVWTPDARFLLYENTPNGLFAQRTDGALPGELLIAGNHRLIPWSFTTGAERLAYYSVNDDTAADIFTVPILRDAGRLRAGQPELFRRTLAFELYPTFSPDGRWIAYGSNESGSWEVYVRSFPDQGNQVRVSSRGGRVAAWSKTSPELLYETNDHRLMIASYRIENGAFVADSPTPWSEEQLADSIVLPAFDLAPDGSVIALLPHGGHVAPNDHVTVLVNFLDYLQSAK
jgi:serine/threonine-protein kinase